MKRFLALPRLFAPRTPVVRRTSVRYFGAVGAPRDRAVFLVQPGTFGAYHAPVTPTAQPDSPSIRDTHALEIRRSMWAQVAQG